MSSSAAENGSRANTSKLLKPVANQHGDLAQKATEAIEIFWLRSPLKSALRPAAGMQNMARGMAE
jgi:hypothetical protein